MILLTDRQQKFADEYIIDCNATRAYKAAYPNVKKDSVARANGSRLLTNANIKNYIEEKLAEISDQKTAKAQEVMEYLTSVMRGESESSVVVVEGYGEGCSEAKIIEKPPDEKERLKAAELLGRHYAIFTDKVKAEGAIPVVISGGEDLED
ncbi:terminase small subunit [Anaerovibrio slackiae]|uniref:terminase small subunit n=1 Tax=Anaerovibrio slackiae TaxID=2652309 RepID=UPI003866F0ED